MNYISAKLYRKMIDHALFEGMQRKDFAGLSVSLDQLDTIKAVPADDFFALHEFMEQNLGAGFSIRVGQEMKIDDYGVLGLSWRTCSKAGEIFERCERYFFMLSNTYVFKVIRGEEFSQIQLNRKAYRRGVALSNEATFSATVVVLQAMTETNIGPVQVAFQHGPPQDLSSYTTGFKCPILFNQPENVITYTTTDLDTRTAKADESINRFLVERVAEETKGMEISPGKIAMDVAQLIKNALPGGIPGIEQVGEQMGMSSRTLTRRLSENGVTFRDLIKQTQEDIARDLLLKTPQTVGEIAFQAGFSEQSAFSRAFKRWTGQSPAEFRKVH